MVCLDLLLGAIAGPAPGSPADESSREDRDMSDLARGEAESGSERKRLFTTFAFLVAKQGATAVLGLAYWVLATRLFASRDVGLAAAAASLAAFLAAIGVLGIPILLLAELSSLEDSTRRAMFTTGLAIACFVVFVLSVVAMALSPFLGKSLRDIGQDPVTAALFVAGTVATVATITFDNAAIGLHLGSAQLTRGTIAGVLKPVCVGLLVFAGVKTSAGLLLAWSSALAASVVVCFPMLRLRSTHAVEGALKSRIALARVVMDCSRSIITFSICRSIPSRTSSR